MKEIDYKKVIEFITPIGYKQRTGTYYVLGEEDGYINISCDKCFRKDIPISFHKNHYYPYRKKDIIVDFYTLDEFYTFISEYHNDLFLKHKLKKLLHNIK